MSPISPEPHGTRPASYRHYLLLFLTAILLFNGVERVALGLLLQNIKIDLHLSDTQLGFLTGIAFALFYSIMGIPIARWADRGNRVWIISVTTALWSAMVSLCGLARSFAQLLLVRVGVAVGEAGAVPPAFSLLGDYYSRAERPRATAIYQMASTGLSVVVGYLLAGWLSQRYGWRMTFMILGSPGLLLSMLAWMILREPRRARRDKSAVAPDVHPMVMEVWRTLSSSATFRNLLLSISAQCFFNSGIGQWLPTYFIRSYGFQTGEIGMWFALICGPAGVLGAYLGGELATRYAAQDERRQLIVTAIAIAFSGILMTLVYLCHSPYVAFVLLAAVAVGLNISNGPLFGTIQTLVPERMRAVALAIVYLFANLIGMGLGPLLVGALSDALRPWAQEQSLRFALLVLSSGYLLFGWFVWRAGQTVVRDMATMHGDEKMQVRVASL